MKCPFCGAEQPDNMSFCTECGKYIYRAPAASAPQTPPPSASTSTEMIVRDNSVDNVWKGESKPDKKSEWATIGTWGWIGILLLLQIPILNFILVLVWSFGGARKNVKQTFARAILVLGLVSSIISIAAILYMLISGNVGGITSLIKSLFR